MSEKIDLKWMAQALRLSQQAHLLSPPNPWVGCVIVKKEQCVGQGHTQIPGGDHAEIQALKDARSHAKGATVYTTLEPCCHWGRTGPCTKALIDAGVHRVVIGLEDPDPLVKGKGTQQLLQAGIQVTKGILKKEISKELISYLHHRKTGRPYCILKSAISIDGRIAASDGTSQWITGPAARKDAHILRSHSQAIVVGSGTALKDHPSLTVRGVPLPHKPPLRVLLDRRQRVKREGALFDNQAPTLVCTEKGSFFSEDPRIQIKPFPHDQRGIHLESLLDYLGKEGVLQVLFEGGAQVHDSLITNGLVDSYVFYQGPTLLGSRGVPMLALESIDTLEKSLQFHLWDIQQLDENLRIEYRAAERVFAHP